MGSVLYQENKSPIHVNVSRGASAWMTKHIAGTHRVATPGEVMSPGRRRTLPLTKQNHQNTPLSASYIYYAVMQCHNMALLNQHRKRQLLVVLPIVYGLVITYCRIHKRSVTVKYMHFVYFF